MNIIRIACQPTTPLLTDDVQPATTKLKTNDAKAIPVDKKVEGKDGKSVKGVKAAKDEKTGEFIEKKGIKTFRSWSNFDIVKPKNDHTYVYRRFKSSPYKPPHIEWNPNGKELAKGYVFITPQSSGAERGLVQAASFIMKQNAEMIYAHDEAPYDSEGFRVQTVHNEQYLTLWRGARKMSHGFGEVIVMNSEYEKTVIHLDAIITNMYGQKFLSGLDFHEQELTTRGTILVTAYNTTMYNLTQMGGSEHGFVTDSLFFEIDIETQEILFSWSALDHFWPEDSMLPLISSSGYGGPKNPYDFFHLSSIQAVNHDSFLISSRNFWSVYLISRSNGRILWELRGNTKGGDFGALPHHGRFRWQNHVRAHNVTSREMILSMFDNHNSPEDMGKTYSRGLLLKLKLPPNPEEKPEILRILSPDRAKISPEYGSYQLGLSNGNQFMSWGAGGVVHEYGPGDGHDLRWQARFGYDESITSYRAFKDVWTGTPSKWTPALVVEKREDTVLGFVSWNGATDIDSYNIYLAEPGTALKPLGKANVLGFETGFDLGVKGNETNCIMVAAVRKGQEIRQSNVGCIEGKTFVSTFVDSTGKATGDSVVEKNTMQKIMGYFSLNYCFLSFYSCCVGSNFITMRFTHPALLLALCQLASASPCKPSSSIASGAPSSTEIESTSSATETSVTISSDASSLTSSYDTATLLETASASDLSTTTVVTTSSAGPTTTLDATTDLSTTLDETTTTFESETTSGSAALVTTTTADASTTTSAAPEIPSNRVLNPGFEENSVFPWQSMSGTLSPSSSEHHPMSAIMGSRQFINPTWITPGKSYKFSAWVKITNTVGCGSRTIVCGHGTGQGTTSSVGTITETGDFSLASVTCSWTQAQWEAGPSVQIRSYCTGFSFFVDDATLEEVETLG
ncbi:ASST-domain-containing protein [Fusarium oxysporum II5]|nr:ASST-domain-containing protein [Fusarium oxysporum II5]